MTLQAEQYWRQRFTADREQLEQIRQEGLAQATNRRVGATGRMALKN